MRLTSLALLVALAGCDSGNYSNEDIDFQLSVPARDDIAVRLPAQALESNDSAEFYRSTHKVVRDLDGSADAFLSLLDHVRAYPPSERSPNRRVWGPFPVQENPLFVARLVIERTNEAGQPLKFAYSIEFRARAASDGPWALLFRGEFIPNADVHRGQGFLQFTAAAARLAGYPLGTLAGIESVLIEYKTDAFPLRVRVSVVNFPAMDSAVYEHTEEQDGSGSIHFTFPTAGPLVTSLDVVSRWLGSGAGRADVKVLTGMPILVGLTGTDCWGIDTKPTYSHRGWEPNRTDVGVESNCVFRAP
jgi:hypothetical protein